MKECFGKVLADVMRRLYIAEVDLAGELGVSPTLVQRWISGAAVPTVEDVTALTRLLRAGSLHADASMIESAAAGLTETTRDDQRHELSRALWPSERELLALLPAVFRQVFAEAFARCGA